MEPEEGIHGPGAHGGHCGLGSRHEAPPASTGVEYVVLDVRALPPLQRHPLIFRVLACLYEMEAREGLLVVDEFHPVQLEMALDLCKETRGRFSLTVERRDDSAWLARISALRQAPCDPRALERTEGAE